MEAATLLSSSVCVQPTELRGPPAADDTRAPSPLLEDHSEALRRFRAGDPVTLDQVYRSYCDDVVRLLRRGFLVKGPCPVHMPGLAYPALQDAIQEVFIRAFSERARLSYDGVRPYRPFLLQIARNVRIDQQRRHCLERALHDSITAGRSPVYPDDLLAGHAHSGAAEEALDWERRRRTVACFLRSLDAEARWFALLRYAEERSQQEIAREMRVTRRRARTLEERLQTALRKHFQLERLAWLGARARGGLPADGLAG